MADRQPFALYNPALLPPDVLLAEFTARKPLLGTLLGVIKSNRPAQPQQHCLIIGQRGAGKTTMLWAVAHSVARNTELGRDWQPVVFDEESRRVGDLADFWLEAIRQWEHATQSAIDLAGRLLRDASTDIEERAQRTFMELVRQSGKRALLLIDNFNDLLGSIHDPEPLHRLRAFLMKEPSVMIIGAASRYFDEITSVDQPFHDFFRCFELHPLSLEEMQTCLFALAETRGDDAVKRALEERSGSVRTLHLLTGGNPRLIKTFYRLLNEGLRGDVRADLEGLLDDFTPYFKSIVDALPTQQQRIFDAVALAWDPVEVASIAIATRLPSNQVSAQLRALMKAGLISETAGRPKRKTYLLADRFSNIHYLMRHGRAARNRFDWFVALVRLVFPDNQAHALLARAARAAADCGPDGQRDARALMSSALNRLESMEARRSLVHATLRDSWDSDALESLDQWFDSERAKQDLPEIEVVTFFRQMPSTLRKQLGYDPGNPAWWIKLTEFLKEKQAWHLAEAAYRKASDLDPKNAVPLTLLGILLEETARPGEAEVTYRKAIVIDPSKDRPRVLLGNLLWLTFNRVEDAEKVFRDAVAVEPKSCFAWFALGSLLTIELELLDEAETALRKALEIDPEYAAPWMSLGLLFTHADRRDEAEAAFRHALDMNPKNSWVWTFLGNLLTTSGERLDDAEAAYRKAIEFGPKNSATWSMLASLLARRGAANEGRTHAVTGLRAAPDNVFVRTTFLELCANHAEDWRAILPDLAQASAARSNSTDIFDFAVEGFLAFARLTSPAETVALLDALPDASPFETVKDALRAYDDSDVLLQLAPERRSIAIELLKRLSSAPGQSSTPRKLRPRAKTKNV